LARGYPAKADFDRALKEAGTEVKILRGAPCVNSYSVLPPKHDPAIISE